MSLNYKLRTAIEIFQFWSWLCYSCKN